MFSWQKFKYYVEAVGFIILLMWSWGYGSLLKSESYSFANEFVVNHPTVIGQLGKIDSSRPGYLNFKQSYAAGIWRDSFNIVLNGPEDSGVAFVNLESTPAGWKINSATLKLKDQSIELKSDGLTQ